MAVTDLATSHVCLFKFKCELINIRWNFKFISSVAPATFQASNSHVWSVDTIRNSRGLDHFHHHKKFRWAVLVQTDHSWHHEIPFQFQLREQSQHWNILCVLTTLSEFYCRSWRAGKIITHGILEQCLIVFGGAPSTLTKKALRSTKIGKG